MSNRNIDANSIAQAEMSSASAPATKELIVLGCYKNFYLCRERGSDNCVSFQTTLNDGIPGSIITVVIQYQEVRGRNFPKIFGTLVSVRYCGNGLGLEPIPMEVNGNWSPEDECWEQDGEETPEWFEDIARRGDRPLLTFNEEIASGIAITRGSSRNFSQNHQLTFELDEIYEAGELFEEGKIKAAKKILMDLLVKDVRCLAAHALLGEIEDENHNEDKAFLHYQMGVSIAQLSLENHPDPVIPWGHPENRSFLRCLYGTGIGTWRSRNLRLAKEIFLKLLSFNPHDNQGVRCILPYIDAGIPYERFRRDEDRLY